MHTICRPGFAKRFGLVLLAALIALVAATSLAPSAHAAGTTVRILNQGATDFGNPGEELALQANTLTGRIDLLPRNAANFRQRWEMESSSFGGRTFRLFGSNVCLAAPSNAVAGSFAVLASCNSVGEGRNRWTLRTGIPGNGASQLVNVKTGLLPMPNFFGNPSNALILTSQGNADSVGSFSEWRFEVV